MHWFTQNIKKTILVKIKSKKTPNSLLSLFMGVNALSSDGWAGSVKTPWEAVGWVSKIPWYSKNKQWSGEMSPSGGYIGETWSQTANNVSVCTLLEGGGNSQCLEVALMESV